MKGRSRIVFRIAFFLSALGVGIELIGLGTYLGSFPFPKIAEASNRPEWLEFLSFFLWLFWLPAASLAGLFLLVAAVIELASTRARPGKWVALGATHLAVVAGILVLDRLDTPERAVRRSAAVVDAIRRYEADRGSPPPSIESLVPGFLPELPNTWCPSYRGWNYRQRQGEDAPDQALTTARGWDLSIDCRRYYAFESLRYEPEAPSTSDSVAECRCIGDWIYWRD